jgi:hypothetical protein
MSCIKDVAGWIEMRRTTGCKQGKSIEPQSKSSHDLVLTSSHVLLSRPPSTGVFFVGPFAEETFFLELEDARCVSTPRAKGLLFCDALNVSRPKAIPRTRCRPRSINPGAHEGDRVPIHYSAKFLAAVHHHEVRCDHTVENPRCGAIRIDRVSSGIVLSPIRSQWGPV